MNLKEDCGNMEKKNSLIKMKNVTSTFFLVNLIFSFFVLFLRYLVQGRTAYVSNPSNRSVLIHIKQSDTFIQNILSLKCKQDAGMMGTVHSRYGISAACTCGRSW